MLVAFLLGLGEQGEAFLSWVGFSFCLKRLERNLFQNKAQGSVMYLDCNRLKLTLNVLPSLSTTSLLPTLPYISFCFNYFLCLTIYAAQNMLHIFWGDNTCPEHHHTKFMVLECLFFCYLYCCSIRAALNLMHFSSTLCGLEKDQLSPLCRWETKYINKICWAQDSRQFSQSLVSF